MAVAVVDERMLREPRLLVPGMQPLGPVRVDGNYNCISFAMFGGGLGAISGDMSIRMGRNRDLMNPGAACTVKTSATVEQDSVISGGSGEQRIDLSWVRGVLSPPYTILVGWDYISGGVSWSFLASAWTGVYAGNDGAFVTTNNADFSGVGFATTVGPRLPSSQVDFGAISISGDNSGVACTNGGAIATDTNFTAPSYIPLYFRVGADHESANQARARVACFAVFKVAMSAAEIQALTRDPYAPLIPA